ncbi:methyltransferase domain-containing protein [Thiospirochaeta perfilievii]|uniref:Methyltransferase domain-containing protein n=1 Tax=Thiospirochaeta perfilievii TaxID=252967 RepID=A0A5C1QCK1_9SPIO|nr:class I SAM-dependent methyltransferase [Thiospirochaeta perfilievii]QEN04404.1 methyltransferase domain-containing protein [Thiospirochaeta perfilievii]
MKIDVNDKIIWDEIYQKEKFSPGWAIPGLDHNIVRIIKNSYPINSRIKVLDIGCGNGRNSEIVERLNELHITYTGIDFSFEAIKYCIKTYNRDKKFLHLDITQDVNHISDKFDIIIDSGCFHSIPPNLRESYINTVLKLSKEGTKLIIAAWWRPKEIEFSIKPSYFPYLYLDEWVFNRSDIKKIFNQNFELEKEYVDNNIYKDLKRGFAYFTLSRLPI